MTQKRRYEELAIEITSFEVEDVMSVSVQANEVAGSNGEWPW
jgi:hypothetical protein